MPCISLLVGTAASKLCTHPDIQQLQRTLFYPSGCWRLFCFSLIRDKQHVSPSLGMRRRLEREKISNVNHELAREGASGIWPTPNHVTHVPTLKTKNLHRYGRTPYLQQYTKGVLKAVIVQDIQEVLRFINNTPNKLHHDCRSLVICTNMSAWSGRYI